MSAERPQQSQEKIFVNSPANILLREIVQDKKYDLTAVNTRYLMRDKLKARLRRFPDLQLTIFANGIIDAISQTESEQVIRNGPKVFAIVPLGKVNIDSVVTQYKNALQK